MRILDARPIEDLILDLYHKRAFIIYARDEENGFVYCTVKYPMIAMDAKNPKGPTDEIEETNKDQIDYAAE